MKRDRSVVVAVKTTRYFVHGKGYSSEVSAWMQVAKSYVWKQFYARYRTNYERWRGYTVNQLIAHGVKSYEEFEREWYAQRYPARIGCNCSFCRNFTVLGVPRSRGCWISKMADYRQIAREIMSGERLKDGTPKCREVLLPRALPMRSTVTDGQGAML